MLSVLWNPGHAQGSTYVELQAAYVYNFAKYITWPKEGSAFTIGIYKDNDIRGTFETILKDKKVRGKPVRLKKVVSLEALSDCQIIYLSESNSKNLNQLIASLPGKSVLIVTEEDLIKNGAAISFFVEDDKLRFKIKKKVLEDAGLVASEGLLKLALLF